MRTIIDLPDDQIAALARLCEREEISRAEAVRRAIQRFLQEKAETDHEESLNAFFGMWKDRDDIGDGVEYQRKLRAEWDDRDKAIDEWAEYLRKKESGQ